MRITAILSVLFILVSACEAPPGEAPPENAECTVPRIVDELDGTCNWLRCEDGKDPHLAPKPFGWDCQMDDPAGTAGRCDGAGVCGAFTGDECFTDFDCEDPEEQCQLGVCHEGRCKIGYSPNNVPCNNYHGTCDGAGICVIASPWH